MLQLLASQVRLVRWVDLTLLRKRLKPGFTQDGYDIDEYEARMEERPGRVVVRQFRGDIARTEVALYFLQALTFVDMPLTHCYAQFDFESLLLYNPNTCGYHLIFMHFGCY